MDFMEHRQKVSATVSLKLIKKRFGEIEDVTDKGYYTNSYHVDVREKIDAFSKFEY